MGIKRTMKLLIATTNKGKTREYRRLLKDARFELVSLSDMNITEKPEENGKTLEENALLKAKFYYGKSGVPTLADDTGLEIDALHGEPGIRVRRWPGYEATDEELVTYTLQRMKGIPTENRTAHFRAVIAIAKDKNIVRLFDGFFHGYVAEKAYYPIPVGYPFRSLVSVEPGGKVLAEGIDENLVNMHREQAIEKALPFLQKIAKVQ